MHSFGFDRVFDPVDDGPLRMARYTEPFALLVAQLGSGPISLASAFGSNSHEASLDKWTTTGNFAPEAGF